MAIIRTQLVLDVATLVWDDTAMSGTAKRVTEPLDLLDASEHASQRPINEVAFTLNWTNDATVVGQFDIEVSNTPLDLGSFVSIKSLAVNNNAGPDAIETATSFGFARLTYTNASGTGTLGVTTVTGKRSAGQVEPAPAAGADLSPASEVLTGDTWVGKPVFRQHFSGPSLANGTTLVTGVDRLVKAFGTVESSGTTHLFSPYHDATNALVLLVNTSDEIKTVVLGSFVGQEFLFTVEYTKV